MINVEKLKENRHILPVCERLILLYNKYSGRIKDANEADVRKYEFCHEILKSKGIKTGNDTLKEDMDSLEKAVNEIIRLHKIG